MSEDNKTLTTDLKILVQGTADCIKIADKNGHEYKLQPLDLEDLCEYEDRVGSSLLALNFSTMKLKDISYMIYLSLRKDGLSAQEVADRKFKFTETEMRRRFDFGLFTKTAVVVVDLLRISGLELKPVNPPVPNPVESGNVR